jgi:xylan 1,4-beta-xylosidase
MRTRIYMEPTVGRALIRNPILPGFHPDPSIVRVGDDYFIATSTFEWFPGIEIHHSRDLVHWRLASRALTRTSQIDMRGEPSSAGVWAPCLSWDRGLFYLVYTDMKKARGPFKDLRNYLVTATDVRGPWSEPVFVNGSGFDPSLFHDDDGRHYLVNMVWDHTRGSGHRQRFGGILLQEYSVAERRLVGPVANIFRGTELGVTEGPHLYRRNGLYYLLCAEGGTGPEHAVTLARSASPWGPYVPCPHNPILTSRDDPDAELRRAGHGDLVETRDGEWYMVHLCSRPSPVAKRSILGRETAIQKIEWDEQGWLRLAGGGHKPRVLVEAPDLPSHPWPLQPDRDDFDSENLALDFHTLRVPLDGSVMSLTERPGHLRLRGRDSLHSPFLQALVARRQTAFRYRARTAVEYYPESFQQMAGLVALYDTENYFYLHITRDEDKGLCIRVAECDDGDLRYPPEGTMVLTEPGPMHLEVTVDGEDLRFAWSINGVSWKPIGGCFDASRLSDEYGSAGHFTGAFIGICTQDLTGRGLKADFDYFEYVAAMPAP